MKENTRLDELQWVNRATREQHRRRTTQKKLELGKCLEDGVCAVTVDHCIETECMTIQVDKEEAIKNKLI
jgi:hypothetical protein